MKCSLSCVLAQVLLLFVLALEYRLEWRTRLALPIRLFIFLEPKVQSQRRLLVQLRRTLANIRRGCEDRVLLRLRTCIVAILKLEIKGTLSLLGIAFARLKIEF